MRDQPDNPLSIGNPTADPEPDLTGRDRMARNVVASWAGHLVFVVAGFVLPRLINDQIGQEALGVWDFAWSLMVYFGLVSGGVMTSISRYVARHRATNDIQGVSATVSTGFLIYLCTGTIVLGFTVLTALYLPEWFGDRIGGYARQAQWVVFLLGVSLVVQFVFAVFNGVVTGCHRWDFHNAITSGSYVLTASGMILALLAGGGLRAMAAVTLGGEVLAGALRTWAAYRLCPELRLTLRVVTWSTAREMISFGGKSMLGVVPHVVLYQTNNLLIVTYLGIGFLPLYARPAALVRHVGRFVGKFAYVLAPTASALQAGTDRRGLQDLFIKGTQYSLYMALPMILILALLGGPLLRLWMGDQYDQGLVLAILAIGHIWIFSQEATYQILMGMGHHGLPGLATMAAAALMIPLAILGLGPLKLGLVGAALALVVPLVAVYALVIPLYGCRVVGIPFLQYVFRSTWGPVVASVPFGLCLLAARWAWPTNPPAALGVGIGIGGAVLIPIYWRWVVPEQIRGKVTASVNRALGRTRLAEAREQPPRRG